MAGVVAVLAALALPAGALASPHGSLTVRVAGLPSGQRSAVSVRGPGTFARFHGSTVRLRHLRAGRYVVTLRAVTIRRGHGRLRAGATAYPDRAHLVVRVRAGGHTLTSPRYGAIVNPSVRPLPDHVLGVIGSSLDPDALVLPGTTRRPRIGTIYTSGATRRLPHGLISRVTATSRQKRWLIVTLVAVSATDAAPQFSFSGHARLTRIPVTTGAARSDGSPCSAPNLIQFHISADRPEIRQADFGIFPPQMRLTIAVPTTESLGLALVSAGLDCEFDIADLGTFQGIIPAGPIEIPVFVSFPVKAGVTITGTLNLGSINLSSTTVASVAAGFHENSAGLHEEGIRVWTTVTPTLTGEADLFASVGVQAGIGVAEGANVHVEADFGPEFHWATGEPCDLSIKLGALSAGVTILGHDFDTGQFTPLTRVIWTGCPPPAPTSAPPPPPKPAPPVSAGSSGGGPTSGNPGGSSGGSGGSSGGGTPPPPASAVAEQESPNYPTNTFTNYHNASGVGPKVAAGQWVQVSCKVYDPTIQSVNPDGYWYRIATSPWSNQYYAPANNFLNGDPPQGPYSRNTDWSVGNC